MFLKLFIIFAFTLTGNALIATQPIHVKENILVSGLNAPTAFAWTTKGAFLIAEKSGIVKIFWHGKLQDEPFIDISSEVNNTLDRGLLGLAVHPNFVNEPFVFLLYTYDPPETKAFNSPSLAAPDTAGNRVARLVRVEAEEKNGKLLAKLNSQKILLGKESRWPMISFPDKNSTLEKQLPPSCSDSDHPNGTVQDCIPNDCTSHSIGDLKFLADGSLLVSVGDGASFNFPDKRALRVQNPDSLSGKILRIDPQTGAGLPGNPYFDSAQPLSNRSKVYALGFRNPFRLSVDSKSETAFVGDVGWIEWEEVNVLGQPIFNFGWPYFEGKDGGESGKTIGYRDFTEAQDFYASGVAVNPPFFSYFINGDKRGAVGLGPVYQKGGFLPEAYDGALLSTDFIRGELTALFFDANFKLVRSELLNIPMKAVTYFNRDSDNRYYYTSFEGGKLAELVASP